MSTATHEDLFAKASPEVRSRLEAIQAEVERRIPSAQRCIAYQMPAFRAGKIFIYFAAFRKHIGIYPPVQEPAELVAELEPWRGPKGNLSFPHNEPLPLDLIGRVIESLADQYATVAR